MTKETEKSTWCRFCETALAALRKPAATRLELPALDAAKNDKILVTLGQVPDGDPMLNAMMSYAQVSIEKNLRGAFNVEQPPDKRLNFLDRAAALAELVETIENDRAEIKEELRDRQKRDQSKVK